MSRKFNIILLISILVLAAAFRLFDLKSAPPGLYPDEAMNGNNALEALATGKFKIFYPENNGREGLFINIQAVTMGLMKLISPTSPANEPWVLRLPSVLFGILTVLGVYFLTKELFGKYEIALLASFLMGVSFWHINFSRIGFRAIMAPFFLTWAIYFLLRAYSPAKASAKTGKFNWSNGSYFLPLVAGAVYGLGFYSYLAYRATPLLILLIFYWAYRTYRTNKSSWPYGSYWFATSCFLLAAIIVALPLAVYFFNNPQDFFGRTTQVSIFSSPTPLKDLGINILKTAGMFNVSGDWNWRHNIAGKPLLFWPVGILFLIGFFLSIKNLFKGDKSAFAILIGWLIIAALPVVISNEGLPHVLRAILMAPPVFILAGFGGMWLYEKVRPIGLIKPLGLIGLIGLITVNAYISYFITWAKNPEVAGAFSRNYVEIGRQLNNLPKELPKFVTVESSGVDVRGIPMPTQTVMFITDTFLPEKQKEKNIFYVLPNQKDSIPAGSFTISI